MVDVPAFITNGRLDIIAANRLGEAFYAPLFANPARPVNSARFAFLDPRASDFFLDWDRIADDTVAILRTLAGANPHDRRLSDLIGELTTRSDDFAARWAAHNVTLHRNGSKRFHHPEVGDLTLDFEAVAIPADPDHRMLLYSAEPASPSHEALRLLSSWAATPAETDEPSDTQNPTV